MSSKSFTSANVNNEELDKDTPLSDEEISRLIQASRETPFKKTAIKEEMAEEFKKVSLHDIAKKYSKDIFTKKEADEDSKNEKKDTKSEETKDTNESEIEETQSQKEKILDKNASIEKDKSDVQEEEKKIVEKSKTFEQEEHLKILEEEKKEAFEKGKQEVYSEIKEGADAAIAKLNSISDQIAKTDQLDLSELENIISNRILDLTSELTGKIIKALPTEFLKKIQSFIETLENNDGKVEIFINENDFKIMEKNKDIKPKLKEMNISHKADLANGEVTLKINGIEIKHKIQSSNI